MARIRTLFFLSGCAGLVYQVVWSRLLQEIFGVTAYAVATVLATFLAGLALGSLVLGPVADRRRRPLVFYGWLEIGVGLAALVGLATIRLLAPAHLWAANRFAPDSVALILFRAGLGALVVLPATFLMGGTLPAITRAAVDRMDRFGRELSLLYGLNTLGAVFGTVATGFLLIRWVGLDPTLGSAVALNLLVGLVSLRLAGSWPVSPRREPSSARAGDEKAGEVAPGSAAGLPFVMFLCGFATLGLEVLWTRVLVFSVGTTTYSFVTMLVSFLGGIGLGSLVARRILDRKRDLRATFGLVQVGIAVATLIALPWIDAGVAQRWLSGWGDRWLVLLLLRFGVSLLVMLVPTTLIGMTFPLAARMWSRRLESLGGSVGQIYGANTLGNIAGAAGTGFVLLPAVGLQKGIALMATLYLVAAAWSFLPARHGATRAAIPRLAGAIAGLAACLVLAVAWHPAPFAAWGEQAGDRTLYYREGVVATVKVIEDADDPRHKWMAVDAIKIGETLGGVDHKQQALAHFPFLLRPDAPPRDVLSIGLGTGILAGEITRHPGVRSVDCVEISPAVIEGARQFTDENHDVLDHPAVRVINDDGVLFLRRTASTYDAIVSDAKSRSTHAANALFFSRDYYRLCLERLRERGLMIQWVPFDIPPRELRTILRTFTGVYPEAWVWVSPPHSCFLVGAREPLRIDASAVDRLLRRDATAGLRRYGVRNAADFLSGLAADRSTLSGWLSRERTINSLRHPVLEFYSPRAYAVPPAIRSERNLAGLLSGRGDALASVTLTGPVPGILRAEQRALGAIAEALRSLDEGGAVEPAVRLVDGAMAATGGRGLVLQAAVAAYRGAVEREGSKPGGHRGLGLCLALLGRADAALHELREADRLAPDDPETLLAISRILATHPREEARRPAEAVRLAERADRLTGGREIQPVLGLVEAWRAAGDRERAAAAAREALARAERAGDSGTAARLRSAYGDILRSWPSAHVDVP